MVLEGQQLHGQQGHVVVAGRDTDRAAHDVGAERLEFVRPSDGGVAQPLQTLLERGRPVFDEPVGVEQEGRARGRGGCGLE